MLGSVYIIRHNESREIYKLILKKEQHKFFERKISFIRKRITQTFFRTYFLHFVYQKTLPLDPYNFCFLFFLFNIDLWINHFSLLLNNTEFCFAFSAPTNLAFNHNLHHFLSIIDFKSSYALFCHQFILAKCHSRSISSNFVPLAQVH